MRFIRNLFFLSFILIPSIVLAEKQKDPAGWQFAGWTGGGCYPDVQFDPHVPNRLYLVSDVAGIWRSDDLGENWRFINKGLGNLTAAQLAIAPSDSNILYAGTKGGLFISKDAGASWSACENREGKIVFTRPRNHRSIAISMSDPAALVIGTASGSVLYSADFGSHWSLLGKNEKPFFKNEPITALQWADKGACVYASSEKGIVKFLFKEEGWKFLADAPGSVTDILVPEFAPDRIYAAGHRSLRLSADAGRSWKESAPIPKGLTYRLAIERSAREGEPEKLWVAWQEGWRGGVVHSRDNGRSWVRDGDSQKMFPDKASNPTRVWAGTDSRVNALVVDPFIPGILFRTDWWGAWRSDDDGLNWHEKIVGAPNAVIMDVALSSSGDIYAASMDDGLMKSSDGGKNYTMIYPAKKYDERINGHVWRVINLSGGRLLGTASPWYGDKTQVFIVEPDGSFKVIRHGLPEKRPRIRTMWEEGYPRALAVDPQNPSRIYLGIDGDDGGGLFISDDEGRHWKRSSGQPGCLRIYRALAVDPVFPKRIYWGAYSETDHSGGIFISEDSGATWKKIFEGMTKVFCTSVAEDGRVFAGGDADGPALFVSHDHGMHWALLKKFSQEGAVTALLILGKDTPTILAGVSRWQGREGGNIYLSRDGGAQWSDITDDLPESGGSSAFVYDSKESYLYVARTAGSVYKRKLSS